MLKRLAYDKMVGNPKNRFVIVDGGHKVTPDNAVSTVIDWLKGL